MKTNYTTKYLELAHDIEETSDLFDYPIVTMFADRFNLGNLIEVTFEEWNGWTYFTQSKVMTVADANDLYKRYIKDGYKIRKEEVF